jgi:hypothetical protein
MAAAAEKSNRRAASTERIRLHIAAATECAGQIAQDGGLSERQRRSILHAFRRVLLPPHRPRRWRRRRSSRGLAKTTSGECVELSCFQSTSRAGAAWAVTSARSNPSGW